MKKRPGTTRARRATGTRSTTWLVVAFYLDRRGTSVQNAAGNRRALAHHRGGVNASAANATPKCFSGKTAVQCRSAINAIGSSSIPTSIARNAGKNGMHAVAGDDANRRQLPLHAGTGVPGNDLQVTLGKIKTGTPGAVPGKVRLPLRLRRHLRSGRRCRRRRRLIAAPQ